ncbi:hypothetical protein IJJ27_02220 [bacterium]|nr:hypothetical protein [bacterium]MBQ6436359.1 hypothetical protein [bacterium]
MLSKRLLATLFLSLMAGLFASSSLIYAQEASESSSEREETDEIVITKKDDTSEENTTVILQNLENLVKDSNQSEQIKNQYDGVTSKTRGFVGQITSLKDNSFKINTLNDEELLIAPDKSTTIVKKGDTVTGDKATLTDWLAIDDWLVLIGVQNGETFQPRRLMVSSDSLAPVETFVSRGVIKNSQSNKIDVQIIGQDSLVETLNLAKTTDLVNSDNETITYKDLTPGSQVLLVGTQKDSKKSLQTLRLL